jgi:hypothetical protein
MFIIIINLLVIVDDIVWDMQSIGEYIRIVDWDGWSL